MMGRATVALIGALVFCGDAALANLAESSLRPRLRVAPEAAVNEVVTRAAINVTPQIGRISPLRPQLRPVSKQILMAAARPVDLPSLAPDVSLRPLLRPESLEQEVLFRKRRLRKGSVCGVIEIQGKKVGDVPGRIRGCGVEDAVQVTSVSGVRLSQASVMGCDTAKALNRWVDRTVKPTFRRRGPVVELKVAAHYTCRTRNNRKGAKISEHGKGRAIDISAFKMNDGEWITVLNGWRGKSTQALLKKVWRGACGPFGTVLGPNADRYHQDHFHMDTARYRRGPYCK